MERRAKYLLHLQQRDQLDVSQRQTQRLRETLATRMALPADLVHRHRKEASLESQAVWLLL